MLALCENADEIGAPVTQSNDAYFNQEILSKYQVSVEVLVDNFQVNH